MIVLGIDTALPACSVAIVDRASGRLLAAQTAPMPVGHAEALMPMVQDALDDAGLLLGDIEVFATTIGPGSFTGVRVGLATARGFALATGRPTVGVTTLQCLADTACEQARPRGAFAVAIDARREELYVQSFDREGLALTEPEILDAAEAIARMPAQVSGVFGSGARLLAAQGREDGRALAVLGEAAAPSAKSVARCAELAGPLPRPLYLRAPDAKPQAAKVLLRQ